MSQHFNSDLFEYFPSTLQDIDSIDILAIEFNTCFYQDTVELLPGADEDSDLKGLQLQQFKGGWMDEPSTQLDQSNRIDLIDGGKEVRQAKLANVDDRIEASDLQELVV